MIEPDPVAFLERFVYDPERGELLQLEPEQKAAVYHLSQTDDNGLFKFSTWLYSAPKKSGKTTVAAGLVLWWACQEAQGQCYVIANDLKQADSRMFRIIEYACKHHPVLKKHAKVNRYRITLSNGTFIEALPIDPTGEAGANPTVIAYTEAWGAKGNKAELMYTEMALSPTRAGKSFLIMETYAGHEGESLILERLYNSVVKNGECVNRDYELYANARTGEAAYWCTRHAMPWQRGALAERYYASEAEKLTPHEFSRLHWNKWATSTGRFVPIEWWDALKAPTPEGISDRVIVGMDAAVSDDYFAMVAVSMHDGHIVVRECAVFEPPKDGKIDYADAERTLKQWSDTYSIACVVYDPHQLHDMATRLMRSMLIWFEAFAQGTRRLSSDKALYDRIRDGKIIHDGNPKLRAAIDNANSKITAEDSKLRIVKRHQDLKIDPAIALSMAAEQAHYLLG